MSGHPYYYGAEGRTLYDVYKKDPKAALDFMFKEADKCFLFMGAIFVWTDVEGWKTKTRYGSYKHITRKMLEGREYEIEWCDGRPSIFFTDAVYVSDHPTLYHRAVLKKDLEAINSHGGDHGKAQST